MIDKLARRWAHTRLFRALGIQTGADARRVLGQFLRFGLVGAANTLLGLALYYLFKWLGLHYMAANVLGLVLGILHSFFWNSTFVFRKGRGGRSAFCRMCVVYGATTLLSTGLLYLWVQGLGISDNIAPLLNLCLTVPLNFVLNKLWAFRDR